MKILSMYAENIKNLHLVQVTLDGKPMVVTGKTGQGKTTSIDLLMMAMESKRIGKETITKGKNEGVIKISIGDPAKQYLVTRRLKKNKETGEETDTLVVKSSDGGTFGPDFLKKLVSELTFDPTEFARAKDKTQLDLLLRVVKMPQGVSIEQMDGARKMVYDQRTTVNRDVKRLEAKLPAMPPKNVVAVDVPALLAELDKEIEAGRIVNTENDEARDLLLDCRKESESLQRHIDDLVKELDAANSQQLKLRERIKKGESIVAGLKDRDLSEMQAKRQTIVVEATEKNRLATEFVAYKKEVDELAKVVAESEGLTAKLALMDENKAAHLKAIVWPLPGLGIRDGQVTYEDVILSECGMSRRMRVSCAIAMAMNPLLSTIRIDEGESLGAEGRAELLKWAAEKDFQVLMTVVKDGPAEGDELEIIDHTLYSKEESK